MFKLEIIRLHPTLPQHFRHRPNIMKKLCVLLPILAAGQACAQDFEAGRQGWQLERLSDDFVLLRTDITIPEQGKRRDRQGLLILTCERGVRRVRFQIGDIPRSPSINASSQGRAIVRGWFPDQKVPSVSDLSGGVFF